MPVEPEFLQGGARPGQLEQLVGDVERYFRREGLGLGNSNGRLRNGLLGGIADRRIDEASARSNSALVASTLMEISPTE